MKCFIISPMGQPGSPLRDHADEVFDTIIRRALLFEDIEGVRADHVTEVGSILYDAILTSDFCVAVLHGFNPNVFYEIAVAHSAGIPVIMLLEEGIDLPFDLKDERAFYYDLNMLPLTGPSCGRELLQAIDSVRKLQGKREVPFGANLAPLSFGSNAPSPVVAGDQGVAVKCFIISPIGQPKSEVRGHADRVLRIIDGALHGAHIEWLRADNVADVGRITRQMYDAILASDFCIAVLHGFNPNVFYEIAVAHSAGIPVIMLLEEGIDLPFGLKDERVFYDSYYRKTGESARKLLQAIDSVRKLQGKREVPFGANLIPLRFKSNAPS